MATQSIPASDIRSVLVNQFGPEAGDLSQELAIRIIAAIGEAEEEANSRAAPEFFRAIEQRRHAGSSMGGTWGNAQGSSALSRVDRALSGISGIAEVLAAGELARAGDSEERQLGENLTDRLFYALEMLADSARADMERARTSLARDSQRERSAPGLGAAP